MAIRSALPWPFRWAVLAVVLGFCAAIGLWAFEFGKDIAGLDKGSKQAVLALQAQLSDARAELAAAKADRDAAQSVSNTADALVTAERASREKLQDQVKQLEADNRSLQDDLGFFEKLIPAAGEGLAIRGLQAEMAGPSTLKWQILVMQPGRNAPELKARLEVTVVGTLNGKPWSGSLPEGAMPITIKQYGRMQGELALPAQVQAKSLSARVLVGSVVQASQSIKL